MPLKLYNTLTRKKEVFKPIKDKEVGIYGCGPTVYWYQHIGNMRRYVFEDILIRTLQFNDYKVKHIINITDVGHLTSDADEGEDKMVKAIKREGLPLTKDSMLKIAQKYEEVFKEDLEKLNILEPDAWPHATKYVKEMIEMVKVMEKKGFAYESESAVYFDVSKFKNYHKLAKLKLSDLKAGARVKVDEEKKNPQDFVLWFKGVGKHKNHLMLWDSPWGKGFPGWHIECSAMSMKHLGEQFDIHTGGVDHISVHHTNEIAQTESVTGKSPWVKYWMHSNHLTLKEGKMSKSGGNIMTLSDLVKKDFSPMELRYLCLFTHYRKKLVFDLENLKSAQQTYQRLKNIISELSDDGKHHRRTPKRCKNLYEAPKNFREKFLQGANKKYLKEFETAMNDDLNTPKALQVLWKLVRDDKAEGKLQTIKKMDEVFGLKLLEKVEIKIPKEVQKLVDEREKVRKKKDWKNADDLRDEIKEKGFIVEDVGNGSKVRGI
ncbi:MAG: cysteine--tRNA ligase [Nanoarchaeota archaeon]|nr:cysteine--tRNA ligase [Nanoarchaeota archaeon]